jgi:hypothetical protein
MHHIPINRIHRHIIQSINPTLPINSIISNSLINNSQQCINLSPNLNTQFINQLVAVEAAIKVVAKNV